MRDQSPNLCGLCRGRRSLFWMQGRTYRWVTCPACEGLGVMRQEQPDVIEVGSKRWLTAAQIH